MANLPIPDEDTWITYSSQTGTGPFSFTFSVFDKADLRVTVGGVELTQADFTFSGTLIDTGYDGGSITLVTAAAAEDVVIWREVAPVRTSDFAPASSIAVTAIDAALDKLTAQAQDARRDLDRTFKVSVGEAGTEQTYDAFIAAAGALVGAAALEAVDDAATTASAALAAQEVELAADLVDVADVQVDRLNALAVITNGDTYDTIADATADTGMADGEYGWVAPLAGYYGSKSIQKVAGTAVRQYVDPLPYGGAGFKAVMRRIRQDEIEADYPFPRLDKLLCHVRAMDMGFWDGQIAPNRRASAYPARVNWLNWTSGEIRPSLVSGHTLTTNASGTAARVLTSTSGTFGLGPIGMRYDGGYTLWAMAARETSAGADQSVRGLQSDAWATEVLGAAPLILTDWTEASHNSDLPIQLAALTGATADFFIDKLFLDDGASAPTDAETASNLGAYHLKSNIARPGGQVIRTSHGGYEIDDTAEQRFDIEDVDATADTLTITGHGLTTGDGPFTIFLSDPRSFNFTADASTENLTSGSTAHERFTGDGPVYLATTGTLPAGLAVDTPYYFIRVSSIEFKFATSYANAVLGTAIDLTDAGTGTHSVSSSSPGGLSAGSPYWVVVIDADTIKMANTHANALVPTTVNITSKGRGPWRLKTLPRQGLTVMATGGPLARDTIGANGLTIQWVGSFSEIANDGVAWCLNYDANSTPALAYTSLMFGIETSGQAMLLPNQANNRTTAYQNLVDMGRQVWTVQIKDGQQVLWKGFAPCLETDAATWSAIELFAINLHRYSSGSTGRVSLPTSGQSDKRTTAFILWDTFLSVADVGQAVDTQVRLLNAEGNPVDVTPIEHVVYGTSIDNSIPSIPGTRWFQLSLDNTMSPRFSHFNMGHGGSSLHGTTADDFSPFADSPYGTKAVIRGCLRNGSKVFLYGVGNMTNDYKETLEWFEPGYFVSDPTIVAISPQDAFDFMSELITDAGGTENTDVFGFMGEESVRYDNADAQYRQDSGAATAWYAALKVLSDAAGRTWLPTPKGEARTQGTGTRVDLSTVAGASVSGVYDANILHPQVVAHGDWAEVYKPIIEAKITEVLA